jgi:hypothetical protein
MGLGRILVVFEAWCGEDDAMMVGFKPGDVE